MVEHDVPAHAVTIKDYRDSRVVLLGPGESHIDLHEQMLKQPDVPPLAIGKPMPHMIPRHEGKPVVGKFLGPGQVPPRVFAMPMYQDNERLGLHIWRQVPGKKFLIPRVGPPEFNGFHAMLFF
jgi:hypothetical protein